MRRKEKVHAVTVFIESLSAKETKHQNQPVWFFLSNKTKANPLNSYTTLGRRRPACKNGMIQPSITDIFKLKIKF